MNAKEFLQSLGIGLSRAIRYSFGGFLLIVGLYLIDSSELSGFIDSVSWQLTALCAIITGAGIYALHRSLIIPIHHFCGIVILNAGEFACDCVRWLLELHPYQWTDRKRNSLSPTRWLAHLKVPFFRRILAYATLRREFFDEGERNALDVVHAESGLTVMVSESLLAISAYYYFECRYQLSDDFFWIGIILFLLSALSGIQQHRVECARFKRDITLTTKLIKHLTYDD